MARRAMTEAAGRDAENKRILSLDGLRAVAILMVLVSHFWMYSVSHNGLNRLFQSGWMGVDLFFVLSGYLITSILLKARESPTYFRTFYLRRTLRIFPPYYALLIIVFVALPLVQPVEQRLRESGWMYGYISATSFSPLTAGNPRAP